MLSLVPEIVVKPCIFTKSAHSGCIQNMRYVERNLLLFIEKAASAIWR